MSDYSFLIANEQAIRQHFAMLQKFDTNASNQAIIYALKHEPNIESLKKDDAFCEQLVKCLFPMRIIELFGGYKKLLSFPSQPCKELEAHYQTSIAFSTDFIPDDIDIILTMCTIEKGSPFPILILRLVDSIDKRNAYLINLYALEPLNPTGAWYFGRSSLYPENSIFCSTALKDGDVPMFERLLAGRNAIDYQRIVCCPFFSEKLQVILSTVEQSVITSEQEDEWPAEVFELEEDVDGEKILQQPVNSSSWVYCPIASRSVDVQSILTMKDAATEEAQAFINGKLVLKAYERYRRIRAENPELSQLLAELTPYNVQQLLMPVKDKNLELAEEIIQIGTRLKLF